MPEMENNLENDAKELSLQHDKELEIIMWQ